MFWAGWSLQPDDAAAFRARQRAVLRRHSVISGSTAARKIDLLRPRGSI